MSNVPTFGHLTVYNSSEKWYNIYDTIGGGVIMLQVCVDVNHFLQEKAEDGLKLLGNRVKTLHISDHDYEDEQHWMPEEGKIDWMK